MTTPPRRPSVQWRRTRDGTVQYSTVHDRTVQDSTVRELKLCVSNRIPYRVYLSIRGGRGERERERGAIWTDSSVVLKLGATARDSSFLPLPSSSSSSSRTVTLSSRTTTGTRTVAVS